MSDPVEEASGHLPDDDPDVAEGMRRLAELRAVEEHVSEIDVRRRP